MDLGYEELIQIIREALPAIWRGRFEVNAGWSVYGLPARLIGILLNGIPAILLVAIIWRLCSGTWDRPDWFAFFAYGYFLGGITAAAFLCVVFREKRREKETIGQRPLRVADKTSK